MLDKPDLNVDDWVGVGFAPQWYIGQFELYNAATEMYRIRFMEKSSSISNAFVKPELSGRARNIKEKSFTYRAIEVVHIVCYSDTNERYQQIRTPHNKWR